MCLGFNLGARDACRMRALQDLLPRGNTAVAVAEKPGEMSDESAITFREHNFQTLRGFMASLTPTTAFVCLDWFWLQQGYYERYGLDWVSTKIPAAFEAIPRLVAIILPLESWAASGGGLYDMLHARGGRRALDAAGITTRALSWEQAEVEHPMVAATLASQRRGDISESDVVAERRHVDASTPFVVFCRDKTDCSASGNATAAGAGHSEVDIAVRVTRSMAAAAASQLANCTAEAPQLAAVRVTRSMTAAALAVAGVTNSAPGK